MKTLFSPVIHTLGKEHFLNMKISYRDLKKDLKEDRQLKRFWMR